MIDGMKLAEILMIAAHMEPEGDEMKLSKLHEEWGKWQSNAGTAIRYQIQKERRLTCFGVPGYVMEWNVYREFDTAEERDKAFDKLMEADADGRFQKHDYDPRQDRMWLHG